MCKGQPVMKASRIWPEAAAPSFSRLLLGLTIMEEKTVDAPNHRPEDVRCPAILIRCALHPYARTATAVPVMSYAS